MNLRGRSSGLSVSRLRLGATAAWLLSFLSLTVYYVASPPGAQGLSSGLVISQIYGGGGNSGATLTHDFIEVFNRGTTPISVNGWSVQYASAAGTSWQVTPLTNFTIQPGQYYLIQQAQGAGGSVSLPAPDAIGTTAMSATSGKVALVNATAALTGSCPLGGSVVDFVGFGSAANCFEGAGPTATLSNTTAALRAANGCTETDNNSTDFSAGAPNPRNTASPFGSCGGSTNPTGVGAANPNPVAPGNQTLLTVAVTPGANPTSTGLAVSGDLSSIGGGAPQTFFDDGTNGDVTAGDNTFSFLATVPSGAAPGLKTLPITITDAQARTGTTTISLNVQGPQLVVISQIYGGGGNSGATFTNDFIELFNRGTTPISLTGWSVQYTSAAGTSWQMTPLSGTLAPGQYYLVQQAAGAGGTTPLPSPDAVGTIAMGAASGKVALVSNATALSGSGCPFGASVVDFIGYGTANCSESNSPAPELSNTTAALRARQGCRDTNNNGNDFSEGAPNPRNTASPINDCSIPPPAFAIHAIQGSGAASLLAGQEVTTSGIVTARKSNGFFLQTPDADADSDPNTSQGIFVFTGSMPTVIARDGVSVVGSVTEFFGLTQVSSTNFDVTVLSSLNTLPLAITLTTSILNPAGTLDQLERFEGMRVSASSLVSIAPTNEFGEIFTVLSGVPRPFREPGVEFSQSLPPGSPCCVPRFDENPERLMVDSDGQLDISRLVVTSGVTLSNVTGPLEFSFSNYKILPDAAPSVTPNLTASSVPQPNINEFTIGSFNLLNFFTGNSNFTDRLNKASLAIRNVMRSPEVIGVEEVIDLATLTALANKINADSGASNPGYQAILLEGDDTFPNDIDVGFLVKGSRVNVVSVTQEGKGLTFTDPTEGDEDTLFERPPLILRATISSPSGSLFPFTVVVNHMQSLIDVDDPVRGPRQRLKRKLQAEFTANLVQSLQSENLVLVGDFNSFQFSDGYVDVIGTIKGQPAPPDQVVLASQDLVDPNLNVLVDTLPATQHYSFVFNGHAQTIDHVLVDGEMFARLSRFAYARNNADFPETLQTDGTRSERISDHDMPVAYFTFPPVAFAFYLHGTGSASNPPILFLDQTAPTAATAKFRDSASLNFSGGNPWKEIGAWPAAPSSGIMTALSNLHVWLGLKNSDDQGTRFDLRAEIYRNGTLVAAGESYCIQGVARNPDLAKEVTVSFAPFSPVTFNGDGLSLKVRTRIGTNGAGAFCGGHSNATGLRLYFDASSRPSRFGATF